MAKKCFQKKSIAVLLCVSLITVGGAQALASTAQSKRAEAQDQLDSVNEEISSIQNQQSALQSEINALDAELVTTIANIDILEDEIAEKEQELAQANADLEEARITEEEQYESMKERIVYMYVNGGNISFFNALLGANSFADALNRVEMYGAVYDTDRELLQEYMDTEAAIEDLIVQIEEEECALQDEEAELETQQASLNSMIASKSAEMSDFDSMLAEARNLAEQYRATIEEQTEIINQEIAAQQAAEQAAAEQAAAEQAAQQEAERQAAARKSDNSNKKSSKITASDTDSAVEADSSADTGITVETDSTADTTQTGSTKESTSGSRSSAAETTGSSAVSGGTGQQVADYACQFVGNPYVWGGTSLTNGCDCSGFIMSVYAHFGVSLPHSSYSLRSVGYAVSASDLQPGDIICYSGHCAIYIGGGQIVHASNAKPYPAGGIKISPNYAYRTVLAIRRIF